MKSDLTMTIDLHTHSILSYDGGISEVGYERILSTKVDIVAITDHNRIDFAQKMQKKFNDKVIVGEEIMSKAGEVIGLFLKNPIEPDLPFTTTVARIQQQGGLVYIPHPFEKARHSVSFETLLAHAESIDIIEQFNARSFGRRKHPADLKKLMRKNIVFASSSDAHCRFGIGTAYTRISAIPTRKNLKHLLQSGTQISVYAPLISYFCPAINKIRKLMIA